MPFFLHPQLTADTRFIVELPLCRLLLMDDARFPWVILAPRREDAREFHDLSAADRALAGEEIARVSHGLHAVTQADKMNIAMLGNQVPQLHAHVIARFNGDAAWPNPVWTCQEPRKPYVEEEAEALAGKLLASLDSR